MRMHRAFALAAATSLGLAGLGQAVTAAELIDVPRRGPGTRRTHFGTSKYMPHQGPREIARRLRQQARLAMVAGPALENGNV